LTIYYQKTYHRCLRTGSSVRTTNLYRAGKWIAEHITLSHEPDAPPPLGVVDAFGAVIQPRGR
jgi:hypothetical protein